MTAGDMAKLALAALLIGAGWMLLQGATSIVQARLIKPAT